MVKSLAADRGTAKHHSLGCTSVLKPSHMDKYDIPNSPSNLAKLKFEKNARRYYYQLTVGCGVENCSHKLCHSSPNGPVLSADAAMIMAVQLSQRPTNMFCQNVPLDPVIPTTPEPLQQPFMSTLLKSTPFASLFHSSLSTDDLAEKDKSVDSIGVRIINSLKLKTKSFMDLPSLWSSGISFKESATEKASPPVSGTATPEVLEILI